ncbi:MAG: L,D-transpeptidase [Acidobacteria bacterium]|nr:L,D-transpeptidase [Acidobacteriota bacterium]
MHRARFVVPSLALALLVVACSKREEGPAASAVGAAPEAPVAVTDVEENLKRELDETVLPLAPGEFRWYPEISPAGPVVILVSIPDQLAKVYRNGVRIGISTVSTGRVGHETPTGVFHILEKDKKHVSNLFKGAAMPNMQRLTWTGIALHAGNLPGYPASHGCVRMPLDFSAKLFEITDDGGTVVIADENSAPRIVAHAGLVLPATEVASLETTGSAAPAASAEGVWTPEAAAEGPMAIVVSSADRRANVFRGGVLIGQVPLQISDPERPLPAGVSVVLDGVSDEPNPFAPGSPMPRWMAVALPSETSHGDYHEEIVGRIRVDTEIGRQVFALLHPGASLVVTNLPLSAESTTTRDFVIASSQLPETTEGEEG